MALRLISVLICTCNRKDNVLPTIRSIQACGYDRFELFVLDQSENDDTLHAVAKLCEDDARVRYVRLDRPSKPRALNRGRKLARGEYVALTDDDCEVKPGWLGAIVETFEANARVGCVYGDVDAGPHNPAEGYVPICRIQRTHSIFELREFLTMPGWGNFGMGANMALRADVLERIGGWDASIGPGARFGSGDDSDVAVRVLAAGHGVAFCADSHVIHYGLRRWASWGQDQARYAFGMGAIFAKQLRCRTYYAGAFRVLADMSGTAAHRLLRRERPLGLVYPRHWLRGAWTGLRHPLDRKSRCFTAAEHDDVASDNRVANVVLRADQNEGGAKTAGDPR